MASLALMADTSEEDIRPKRSIFQNFLEARTHNPSKTQKWLLEEDCHNIFAFIGGYIDSAGYVKLSELFTSSITGNLVAATASIYSQYGVISRVLVAIFFAIAVYITGMVIFKLKLKHEWTKKSILRLFLVLECIVLLAGMIWGHIFNDEIDDSNSLNHYQLIVCACCLSFSMGLQSAVVKEVFPNCPSTTVITMMIVTFASQGAGLTTFSLASSGCNDIFPPAQPKPVDHLDGVRSKRDDYETKIVSTGRQLFSFLIGGVVGASLMYSISFYSILIPIGWLCLIVVDASFPQYHAPINHPNTDNTI